MSCLGLLSDGQEDGHFVCITLKQDLSVPQSWFLHFYAIGAVVNGLVLVKVSSLAYSSGDESPLHRLLQVR